MKIVSLFDGMSCGRIALDRSGLSVTSYHASEIDQYAQFISAKNYPDIMRLGDINNWKSWNIPEIDILMGGSPCQGFSNAGLGLNFNDPRSKLFFTFVEIKKKYKPKYFLLENVKMKKEWADIITNLMEVEPIEINSALVSAQNRKRLYWTNIPGIEQPEDKGYILADIIEHGYVDREKAYAIDSNYHKGGNLTQYFDKSRRQLVFAGLADDIKGRDITRRIYYESGLAPTLSTMQGGHRQPKVSLIVPENVKKGYVEILPNEGVDLRFINSKDNNIGWYNGETYRKLTPLECERLQTLPDNYTEGVSNTQRYKMIGNGWTVDVIAHILRHIPKPCT